MSINKKLLLRNRILGVLIRDARQVAKKTPEECASFVGIPYDAFVDIEAGRRSISLPELEAFANLANIPLDHFWGDKLIKTNGKKTPPTVATYTLRNRIIGAKLRQARLSAGKSKEACAEAAGISGQKLDEYELGRAPIPIPELESLTSALGISLDSLFESHDRPVHKAPPPPPPVTLSHLSRELEAFVQDPLNAEYLRTAQRLSKLPTDELRRIAETLLEITY